MKKILVLSALIMSFASAHSVKIFTNNDESNLHIKTYFYGGSACKNCKIEIFNQNELLGSYYSDDKGILDISLPQSNKILIKAHAGSGHFKQVEYEIKNIQQNNNINNSNNSIAIKDNLSKMDDLEQNNVENFLMDFVKSFGAIVIIFVFFALVFLIKNRNNVTDNSRAI